MPLRLPEEYADKVDRDRWGKEFCPNNVEDHTTEIVTGHILNRLLWYKMREYDDYTLWEYYREDFQNWTKNIFFFNNTDDLRDLRNHLREYDIFILKNGKRITENLANIVTKNKYHK